MKAYERQKDMWNEIYSKSEPVDLRESPLNVEPLFDTCLMMLAYKTSNVLDFGCGTGDILFQYAKYKKRGKGVGIDQSEKGVSFAKETAKKSEYHNLHFFNGDEFFLDTFEPGKFDGIILSNVLDIMPKDESQETLLRLDRVLSNEGYWFIKLNPFYSEDQLKDMEYDSLGGNMYGEKGVLHLRQESTPYWMEIFSRFGEVERYVEFPYSWQPGMNRIFLIKKKVPAR